MPILSQAALYVSISSSNQVLASYLPKMSYLASSSKLVVSVRS